MKKLFFTLLMSLVMMSIGQAQVVTSVAGLNFGTSKQAAISYLKSHFGTPEEQSGDYIRFKDKVVGGRKYNFLEFYFSKGVFVSATLQNCFPSYGSEQCEMDYNQIVEQYKNKYSQNKEKRFGDDPDEYWVFGQDKTKSYYAICIYKYKSNSIDGRLLWYTMVEYYRDYQSENDDI